MCVVEGGGRDRNGISVGTEGSFRSGWLLTLKLETLQESSLDTAKLQIMSSTTYVFGDTASRDEVATVARASLFVLDPCCVSKTSPKYDAAEQRLSARHLF